MGLHWYISFVCTRPFDKNIWSSFFHLFILCARPFDQKIGSSLIYCFVHDHSTKLGVTHTLLFIPFLDVPIFPLLYSWQILPLLLIGYVHSNTIFIRELFLYFVRYIHGYMNSKPNGRVFSVLGQNLERHKWSFVLYIVSFSAFKIFFSKLSLAKYHCLHKKPYFMSSVTTERLYKSLFYKFFCTNLSQVVLRRFYTERFFCNTICVVLV